MCFHSSGPLDNDLYIKGSLLLSMMVSLTVGSVSGVIFIASDWSCLSSVALLRGHFLMTSNIEYHHTLKEYLGGWVATEQCISTGRMWAALVHRIGYNCGNNK